MLNSLVAVRSDKLPKLPSSKAMETSSICDNQKKIVLVNTRDFSAFRRDCCEDYWVCASLKVVYYFSCFNYVRWFFIAFHQ